MHEEYGKRMRKAIAEARAMGAALERGIATWLWEEVGQPEMCRGVDETRRRGMTGMIRHAGVSADQLAAAIPAVYMARLVPFVCLYCAAKELQFQNRTFSSSGALLAACVEVVKTNYGWHKSFFYNQVVGGHWALSSEKWTTFVVLLRGIGAKSLPEKERQHRLVDIAAVVRAPAADEWIVFGEKHREAWTALCDAFIECVEMIAYEQDRADDAAIQAAKISCRAVSMTLGSRDTYVADRLFNCLLFFVYFYKDPAAGGSDEGTDESELAASIASIWSSVFTSALHRQNSVLYSDADAEKKLSLRAVHRAGRDAWKELPYGMRAHLVQEARSGRKHTDFQRYRDRSWSGSIFPSFQSKKRPPFTAEDLDIFMRIVRGLIQVQFQADLENGGVTPLTPKQLSRVSLAHMHSAASLLDDIRSFDKKRLAAVTAEDVQEAIDEAPLSDDMGEAIRRAMIKRRAQINQSNDDDDDDDDNARNYNYEYDADWDDLADAMDEYDAATRPLPTYKSLNQSVPPKKPPVVKKPVKKTAPPKKPVKKTAPPPPPPPSSKPAPPPAKKTAPPPPPPAKKTAPPPPPPAKKPTTLATKPAKKTAPPKPAAAPKKKASVPPPPPRKPTPENTIDDNVYDNVAVIGHVLGISLSRNFFDYIATQSLADVEAFSRVANYVAKSIQAAKPIVLLGKKNPRRIDKKTGRFEDFDTYYRKWRRTKGQAFESKDAFARRQSSWLSANDTPKEVQAKMTTGFNGLEALLRYIVANNDYGNVNNAWKKVMGPRSVDEKRQLADVVRLVAVMAKSDNLNLSTQLAHGMRAGSYFMDQDAVLSGHWQAAVSRADAHRNFSHGHRRLTSSDPWHAESGAALSDDEFDEDLEKIVESYSEDLPVNLGVDGVAIRNAVIAAMANSDFQPAQSAEESRARLELIFDSIFAGDDEDWRDGLTVVPFDDALLAVPDIDGLLPQVDATPEEVNEFIESNTLAVVFALSNTIDRAASTKNNHTVNAHQTAVGPDTFRWATAAPYTETPRWHWNGEEVFFTEVPALD